ncbi:MAG: carboxypeptidase-like regulatory domain-containing protein [Bacteroidota bacterium]
MKTSNRLFLILLLGFSPFCLKAQTQVVKGTILDKEAEYPLIGATVIIADTDPILGGVTDIDGIYRIANVPIGRQTLIVQYVGYKSITIPNVLVTSGKEVIVDATLEESVQKMEEVVVTADTDKDIPLNELAKVSARTFSTEEVLRYSGGRNDVARLTSNFAGVSTPDDSRNDIVVRGNSPTALLWKVEGIPMANVNHFATLGTTGGPVSALNTNLLSISDFLTGAFPAEYGNAIGAAFDINFRNGNSDTHEFTAQVGAFTGIEVLAEGPLSQAKNSSFLVSYRYGIARFATPGTSASPIYQDLAFKLNFKKTPIGKLSFFGIGGLSRIDFIGDEVDETDLFANPNEDAFYNGGIGLIGMSQVLRFGKNTFVKNSIGFTINKYDFDQDNFFDLSNERSKYRAVVARENTSRYTISSQLNTKFSARFNLRAGVLMEQFYLKSDVQDRDDRPLSQIPDDDADGIPDFFFQVRDTDEYFWLFQPYFQSEYKFTDELSITAGLHAQTLTVNDKTSIEPRAGISWQFKPRQTVSFAYGLHSQNVPFPILFLREETSPGIFRETNRDLDFIKSHHYVLAYDFKPGDQWRLKAEIYYQDIFNVPIERSDTSSYSVINEGADFVFDERVSLVDNGTGFNYGVELTLEKFFSGNYYGLLTTSLFESRYRGGDGAERNTAFNNNYVINALIGKEWKIGNDKKNILTFDTKFTTSGGRPFTPVNVEASIRNNNDQVLFENIAFSERLRPYLRWDVKFGIRLNVKNKKRYHQFFLDLQNITNRSNEFTSRYNEVTQEVNIVEQIGFFPDILYRFQF